MPKKFKGFKKLPKLGTYQGKYIVRNRKKYIGDPFKVTYRSNWEKQVFKYCEEASWIHSWGSEVTIIPYLCETDKRWHRYFVDVTLITNNKEVVLVEIKPFKQTKKPVVKRRTRYALNEIASFVKNQSKWAAASRLCEEKGWKFEVWTEHELRKLGLKI